MQQDKSIELIQIDTATDSTEFVSNNNGRKNRQINSSDRAVNGRKRLNQH